MKAIMKPIGPRGHELTGFYPQLQPAIRIRLQAAFKNLSKRLLKRFKGRCK
jgi:hypothetical protein